MLPPGRNTGGLAALSLRAGDLLGGRYRLGERIASRTGDARFDAIDLTTGARVSVELLLAPGFVDALAGDCARIALLEGARRARSLAGPHVARVLDAGVTLEGHPWIVGEHIALAPLGEQLQKGATIPTAEAIDITLAVCDALAELHGHGIVHGAIGPRSVHVARTAGRVPEVKLAEAGTAQARSALALGARGDVECSLRSPEQLRHTAIGPTTDVWATAVLLHTMVAGAAPFSVDTPSGASLSVILDDPPKLADVDPALATIVASAMAREPRDRPPSILDLAAALAEHATDPEAARDRIALRRATLPEDGTILLQALDGSFYEPDDTIRDRAVPVFDPIESAVSVDIVLDPALTSGAGASTAPARRTQRRTAVRVALVAAALAAMLVAATEGARHRDPREPSRTAVAPLPIADDIPLAIDLPEVTPAEPREERARRAPGELPSEPSARAGARRAAPTARSGR